MSCPACGDPTAPSDRFCESCGTDLREPAAPLDHVEADLGALAGVSDRGTRHERNEDAMALGRRPGAGPVGRLAAVVCDGVSSVRSPERASRAAADTTLQLLLADADGPAEERIRDAVAAAASAVATLAAPGVRDAPSCTLVAGLVEWPGDRPEVTVAWIGDSRAYWLAAPGAAEPASVLTADHSWAAEMVTGGVLDEAAAMADRRAHAITRWLGADGQGGADVVTLRPAGPGVLLLCSDGLWNYVPAAAELAALTLAVMEHGPLAAAAALTTVALDAGGRDNITVVAIPVPASPGTGPEPTSPP